MRLAIDIGGTKTLLAVFDRSGEVRETLKFPTNHDYPTFITELGAKTKELEHQNWTLAAVAMPGEVDHKRGIGVVYGNLPWRNVPIKQDVEKITACELIVENDAKLAALASARALLKGKYPKVLYITISTGIGAGLIINDNIDPNFNDTEIGFMMLERGGKMVSWESFASGSAIVRRFGKRAGDIDDPDVWKIISHDIAVGLIDVLAVLQPDIVLFGGGVGAHFKKYHAFLDAELKKYSSPMVKIPPLRQAANPEEAVIYGCWELMKDHG